MRKVLVLAAALVLCAGQAIAQQQQAAAVAAAEQTTVVAAAAPAPSQADAQVKPAPSVHVSTDEIRAQVRQSEQQRAEEKAQVGNQNWWYLVAAIAIGIIIAALVLD